MSALAGLVAMWLWTTFLINGIEAQSLENEATHPRQNLGLSAKRLIHSPPPHHHHHHHHHHHNNHHKKNDDELARLEDLAETHPLHSKFQPKDTGSFRERRKRYNSRQSKGVEYRQMTSAEEREFQESRKNGPGFLEKSIDFEVEVKEAQNNSVCDYKVVSIPDLRGNRMPAQLEHVICNHAGSRCQDMGFYYCLQTYRMIDVYYGDERSQMKIYAGCVCALFDFPVVKPQSPRIPLDY